MPENDEGLEQVREDALEPEVDEAGLLASRSRS